MRKPSKTALFETSKAYAAAVEALLAAAPDLAQVADPKGRTALYLACSVKPSSLAIGEPNGLRTVAALLKAGTDLEVEAPMDEDEGDFRVTPLWYAVAWGENLPLVRFLLTRGADPSYSLWAVVWRDDDVVCHELLKNRPRLVLRDSWRDADLLIFYAARLKRLKTLDLLIEAGADPTIMDNEGRDAVDIARAPPTAENLIDRLAASKRAHPTNEVQRLIAAVFGGWLPLNACGVLWGYSECRRLTA
jgi:ankyrin repeat protein